MKETFSTKIDSNAVLLHFQGLLLLLNIKFVDFQNIFFSDFFTGPRLRPKAKKWKETFSTKIDSNAVLLHFHSLLLQLNIKFVDFQNMFFSELFTGPRLRPKSQKMKGTFSTKIDSNAALLRFQGPAVLFNKKFVDFQIIFFSDSFSTLSPKMNWHFISQNRFECCWFAFSGSAFAIEHKICGFSKYIFLRFFHRSAPAA